MRQSNVFFNRVMLFSVFLIFGLFSGLFSQQTPTVGIVLGIGIDGQIWYRQGISSENLYGTGWAGIDGRAVRIAVSGDGKSIWCVNGNGQIYFREGVSENNPFGAAWTNIDGAAAELAVGPEGQLWILGGVNVAGGRQLFFREGITAGNRKGAGWSVVEGGLVSIAVGPGGQLWGVNNVTENYGNIFFREGITAGNPKGTSWTLVTGQYVAQIAVSSNGQAWCVLLAEDEVFGTTIYKVGDAEVLCLQDVTKENPKGTMWTRLVNGESYHPLAKISIGPSGQVWGFRTDGSIWIREGITESNSRGMRWVRSEGLLLRDVAVGPMPAIAMPVVGPAVPDDEELKYGNVVQLWSNKDLNPWTIVTDSDTDRGANQWGLEAMSVRDQNGNATGNTVKYGDVITLMWTNNTNQFLHTFPVEQIGGRVWGEGSYRLQILDETGNASKMPVKRGALFKLKGLRHGEFLKVDDKKQVFARNKGVYEIFSTNTPPLARPPVPAPMPNALTQTTSGQGAIWGVGLDHSVWFRYGITAENPNGVGWGTIDSKVVQLAAGPDGQVWALGIEDVAGGKKIYFREGITKDKPQGTSWTLVDGGFVNIAVGPGGQLWGVNNLGDANGGTMFFREGITAANPKGSSWKVVEGTRAIQVVVGPGGEVFHVNAIGTMFFRDGITPQNPTGTSWALIDGKAAQMAIGPHGQLWHLPFGSDENGSHDIYFREGVTKENPKGTVWKILDEGVVSRLAKMYVGPSGQIWGMLSDNSIFIRGGVTSENPRGTGWIKEKHEGKEDWSKLINIAIGPLPAVADDKELKYGNVVQLWSDKDLNPWTIITDSDTDRGANQWGLEAMSVRDQNGNATGSTVKYGDIITLKWTNNSNQYLYTFPVEQLGGKAWGEDPSFYQYQIIDLHANASKAPVKRGAHFKLKGVRHGEFLKVDDKKQVFARNKGIKASDIKYDVFSTNIPDAFKPKIDSPIVPGEKAYYYVGEKEGAVLVSSEKWKMATPGTGWVKFKARGLLDLCVAFSSTPDKLSYGATASEKGERYRFYIGTSWNGLSSIRRDVDGKPTYFDNDEKKGPVVVEDNAQTDDPDCVITGGVPGDGETWDDYWFAVKDGTVYWGKGTEVGEDLIQSWVDSKPLKNVQYVCLGGWVGSRTEFKDIQISGATAVVTVPEEAKPEPAPESKPVGTKSQVAVGFDGQVWALSDEDVASGKKIYFREGITKDNPKGTSWTLVSGGLVSIAVGQNGQLWGANDKGNIFFREGITKDNPKGSDWIGVDGGAVQIAAGVDGQVWTLGGTGGQEIFFREGITKDKPKGTSWSKVEGGLVSIAVGQNGQLWGANDKGTIYFRGGITKDNPKGFDWQATDGLAHQVAVGANGQAWVLDFGVDGNGNRNIWSRDGITKDNPKGTAWKKLDEGKDSRQAQLSVGANGQVWGVLSDAGGTPGLNGSVWFREGITAAAPMGTVWTRVETPSVVAQIDKVDAELKEVENFPFGFVKVPGTVKKVAVGLHSVMVEGKEKEVLERWAIGTDGKLSKGTDATKDWVAHVAKDDKGVEIPTFVDVAIGGDGTVYAIASDGKVYRYNRQGEKITAEPSEIKEETKKEDKAKKAEVRAAKKAKKLKRPVVKKAAKKAVKKKATVKKTAVKKTTKKKVAPKKKTITKKATEKKQVVKKTTAKKSVEKTAEKQPVEKKVEEKTTTEKTAEKTTESTASTAPKKVSPFAGAPAK